MKNNKTIAQKFKETFEDYKCGIILPHEERAFDECYVSVEEIADWIEDNSNN